MSIEVMQWVDYHFGIPLCFLATLWVKLTSLWARKPSAPPKRVLFIELSEMGSVILADPALRYAQKNGAEVFFAIFEGNANSIQLLGTVPMQNVFAIRNRNFFILAWDVLRYLSWTRRMKIDTVVDLELFSRFTSLLTAFSGARQRVGFFAFFQEGLYRGHILTRPVAYNSHIHMAKNILALVKTLFQTDEDHPFYKGEILDSEIRPTQALISPESMQRVQILLNKILPDSQPRVWLILNCSAGEFLPQRRWPKEHFASLIQMILDQNPVAAILLTGAREERDDLERIRAEANRAHCFNIAGEVGFGDLPALYSIATLMITNDSGPAHFASTTDIRTFVFFGPETPNLYGSLGNLHAFYANYACSPCVSAFNHRKTNCQDNRCLKVISPEHVYQTVAPYLSLVPQQKVPIAI